METRMSRSRYDIGVRSCGQTIDMPDPDGQPVLALHARDGVLNVYKPPGLSSAQALYRVRGLTGIRRSGHAGALDPLADGVLLICLGRSTKLVERLMGLEKVYEATARLDVTNASFDAEQPFEPVEVARRPTPRQVAQAASSFVGRIAQVPPDYSAVKVDGRPAYRLARRRRPLALRPRAVVIHALTVTGYRWPELSFTLRCGRGTYVRSLIRDWGRALGVGGCLTRLTRTRIGPFTLEDSLPLDAPEPLRVQRAFRTDQVVRSLFPGEA